MPKKLEHCQMFWEDKNGPYQCQNNADFRWRLPKDGKDTDPVWLCDKCAFLLSAVEEGGNIQAGALI